MAPATSEKTVQELCAPGHAYHMMAISQDKWLKDTLAKYDQMRAEDDKRLNEDVMKFRETGKWPKRQARQMRTGKHEEANKPKEPKEKS